MHLDWHHLVVDGDIGVGEYTYAAIASTTAWSSCSSRRRDRAVAQYQIESALPWDGFVGASRFA